MRMLRRKMNKLEAGDAAARAANASRPIALVWTEDNRRIPEDQELAAGEHIAVDVHVLEQAGDFFEGAAPSRYRVEERITTDPNDNGSVYDANGRAVGRVRPTEPPYLDIEWFEAAG